MRPGSVEVYVSNGATGFDDSAVQQYRDGMWKEDYAVPAAQIPGITFETHSLVPRDQQDRHTFARWLKSSAGSHRLIGRSVSATDGLVAGLALHFPNGLRRRPAERAKFDLIAPHFGRAFQLAGRFTEALDERASLALAVERLRQSVILLDGAGRVLWANAAARGLLHRSDGLSLFGQRLRFVRLADEQAFESARRRLRMGLIADSSAGSLTVPVARPSGRPNYVIEVFETPPAVMAAFGRTSKVLVMIHDPDANANDRPDIWRAMFGLTEAEARVARGLQRGHTDEAIALALSIKVSTVRTHIRVILEKTGVRSKLELAHLLTSVG
jgi:DNA-binding CsgD family transcriptional regulator/PAS domain-containing protein